MFSKFILGTVQLGMPYGIGQWKNTTIPEKEAFSILDKSWEIGFNTLDTSPIYGKSNSRIRKFMKLNPRKEYHIILKIKNVCSERFTTETLKNYIYEQNFLDLESCKSITILLHQEKDIYNNLIVDQLNQLSNRGFIKQWGISIYSSKIANKTIEFPECKVIQLPFSILNQSMLQDGTISKLKKFKKIILARSIFTKGLLFEQNKNNENLVKEVTEIVDYLAKYSSSIKQSISQIASRFVLSFDEIKNIVIGFDNTNQIQDFYLKNFMSLDKKIISDLLRMGKLIPDNVNRPEKW